MRITLPSGTPAEVAVPSGRPTRGVAPAPDIAGLRDLFDDLCQRLADDYGWTVCAAEPFPGRESMSLEERFQAMPALEDSRQVGDLVAAADVITERTGVDRVAVLGFC